MEVRHRVALARCVAAGALLTPCRGCARSVSPLESYTDPGDGCRQAVSAISYADDVLKPLGQEPYQDFDSVVRGRLAAVEGTLSLEERDWPTGEVHEQADVVEALARRAAVNADTPERVESLLEYRAEAAVLVMRCRQVEADG